MKTSIFIVLLALATKAFAQPTVEGTYLPVHNTVIKQVYDTVAANLEVPTRGPNQVWDYTNSFTNILDTFELQTFDANATPYVSDFPGATHASFLRAPFNFADSIYSYFIVDTNGIQNLGFYSIKEEYDTSFVSSPTEWVIPFEINYGDTIRDTSITTGILKDYYPYLGNYYDVKYISHRTKDMVVDGYGTLSTPLGTFNDVLLGTEKQHVLDSFFVDVGLGWTFAYLNDNYFHRFHFLRNNTFATSHLMQLNSDTSEIDMRYGWFTLPANVGEISGTVYDTSGLAVTDGEILLYRENSNFTKNDVLATTTVDGSGNYLFTDIPYGEYRISCRPNLAIYGDAMTSYVGDTTDWINCQTILTSGPASTGNDIFLVYHENHTGGGQITGSLQQDYSYSKACGDPIPGIDIIIEKTPGGTVTNGTTTGSTGLFTLNNLNDGDYTIFVDVPGLNMVGSYDFTISGGTVVNDLDFKVGFDSIHPIGVVTVVEDYVISKAVLRAYPNPFNTRATLEIDLSENSQVEISIFNLLGKKLANVTSTVLDRGTHQFKIGNLMTIKGIYFAKVRINGEEEVVKLLRR